MSMRLSSVRQSTSSSISTSGGLQLIGSGRTRISTSQSRSPSMYGGSGGYRTLISQSQSAFTSGSLMPYIETGVVSSEKVTMQNLNDRLASYLQEVRTLEAANTKLELQIREYYEKQGPVVSRDFSKYLATIADLRARILKGCTDNQSLSLQIDNAQLAADDFKIKYEVELNIHTTIEADLTRLRGLRDSLTIAISDLQMQVESLREELVYLKKEHEEEMHQAILQQQKGTVNVEVDSIESVDLQKVLEEVRTQYESLVAKNKVEVEKWFQTKMEALQTTIIATTTEVKTYHLELSELKRTYQNLEINRDSIMAEIQCLQQNVDEVNNRFSVLLNQLQVSITTLEMELQQVRISIEKQQGEYNLLLDIKMRLEMEIAEYRRLLDGEQIIYEVEEKKPVIITKVVEETKPVIERRVKTIVEKIVDGKVVSTVVDTQLEEVQ